MRNTPRTPAEREAEELRARVRELEAQSAASRACPLPGRHEYRSTATLGGLPLVHVCVGPDPQTGAMRGVARGVVAIGDIALGGIAIGGFAAGGIAIGGVAIGLISFAGCAIGLLAAIGGFALGGLALGGMALGVVACGGSAVGYIAVGGQVFGTHPLHGDPAAQIPEIIRLLRGLLGSRP